MTWKPRHSVLSILSAAYLLCYGARMMMGSAIPFIAKDFNLSPLAMGGVLSAFFMGYSVMQIPGGLLVDRFGPNRVLTAAVAGWSLFTAATGLATSLVVLVVVRVLFGVTEAPFPSSASKALALLYPAAELGRATGLMLSATQLGASLAPPLVAMLVLSGGWRLAFFSLLVPGLLVAIVIKVWVKDSPAPDLAAPDATGANAEAPAAHGDPSLGSPVAGLKQSLHRPAVLWLFGAAFFSNLANWGLMNWLPTYLLQARGFSIAQMGAFASLPSLAGSLGYIVGGQIADRWFNQRRQLPVLTGLTLSALFTYLAATAATGEQAIAHLVGAYLFLSVADSGISTLPMILVPRNAIGGAYGLVNTGSQLAGFLSPLLVGYLLDLTHGNFTLVFYGFVGCLLAAALSASRIRQNTPIGTGGGSRQPLAETSRG
ncbi:MAG TPA: MFS transporter [Steroidobacteraceae bacterium]|nr:MFS transporter [Steroidobacteraceae bacterium]